LFRAIILAAAALAPMAWALFALGWTPSDGTVVFASSSLNRDDHWGTDDGVIIRRVYGTGPLADLWHATQEHHPQQTLRVSAVDGISLAQWPAALDDPTSGARPARMGQERLYTITIDGSPQAVPLAVTLRPYPILSAALHNPGAIVLWLGLLGAGGFVFWRRPRDLAARALLGLGVFVPIGLTAWPLALQVVDLSGGRGLWPYVVAEIANSLAWGAVLLFALAFPEPVRALARRPPLAVVPFAVPFALYALYALTWAQVRPADGFGRTELLLLVSAPAALVMLPLVVGILVWRSRQPMPREHKLALRIVLISVLLCAVIYLLLGQLPQLVGASPGLGLQVMPFALAVMLLGIVAAVLRYRLYEVDVIVRRSLLLVVAASVLAGCFVGLAALLEPLLDPVTREDNPMTLVLLGGALAVALIPVAVLLRRRLNRLIFGSRDDPYEVVSELRGLGATSSVEQTLTLALETLARNLRLGYAAVHIDATEAAERLAVEIGRPQRAPTVVELESNGTPWGRLTLGVAPGREPFGPRDARLLNDVGSQIGAFVQSLVMNRALQRSRERIITAREEERRRVRRDLHDGLGPALATQSMKLQVAAELVDSDPEEVGPMLRELAAEARAEIAEIRRLVDDLRPRVLDQLGLVSALRQRAASFSTEATHVVDDRTEPGQASAETTLRWDIDAEDVEPLPAAVEVAAYRIVIEAVNNAAKHANASSCRVSLARRDTHLEILISDDGVGLPDQMVPGVGLGSMRERAEELGGSFTLSSDPFAGTTIRVRLPLSSEASGHDEELR
jgi:signal transduction histidine kinase